jgi:hypothetical protein
VATYQPPLPTEQCRPDRHELEGGCAWCCDACDYDRHICHFCGDYLRHDGKLLNGEINTCYAECAHCGHIGHLHYSGRCAECSECDYEPKG